MFSLDNVIGRAVVKIILWIKGEGNLVKDISRGHLVAIAALKESIRVIEYKRLSTGVSDQEEKDLLILKNLMLVAEKWKKC